MIDMTTLKNRLSEVNYHTILMTEGINIDKIDQYAYTYWENVMAYMSNTDKYASILNHFEEELACHNLTDQDVIVGSLMNSVDLFSKRVSDVMILDIKNKVRNRIKEQNIGIEEIKKSDEFEEEIVAATYIIDLITRNYKLIILSYVLRELFETSEIEEVWKTMEPLTEMWDDLSDRTL